MIAGCSNSSIEELYGDKNTECFAYETHQLDGVISGWNLFVDKDYLFILDKKDPENAIKILDRKTFEILKEFGPRGRGPNELLNPAAFSYNPVSKTIWVVSTPPGTMLGCKIDTIDIKNSELITGFRAPIEVQSAHFVFNTDSTYLLAHTDDDRSHVLQYNGDGTNKMVIAKDVEELSIKDPFTRLVFYARVVAYDYKKEILYSAFWNQDMLTRTDMKTGKVAKFVLPNGHFSTLNVDATDPNYAVNQWYGFSKVRYKNGLLYASYRGVKKSDDYSMDYSRNILVFDGNFKPIINLIFDIPIAAFDVSDDGLLYIINPEKPNCINIFKLDIAL